MAIKAKETIRHNGTRYQVNDVINDINIEEAERLVKLGVASFIKEEYIERTKEDGEDTRKPEKGKIDYKSQLDEKFNANQLKETAKKTGIEFQSNISKTKLIDLIIEIGKAEEIINFEEEE